MGEVTRLPTGKATPEDALEWLRARVEAGEVETVVIAVSSELDEEAGTHSSELYRTGTNGDAWYLLSWAREKMAAILFE